MSASISVTVANLTMEALEVRALASFALYQGRSCAKSMTASV